MTSLCFEILGRLEGRTLVTAESCTGGLIGGALTAVSGSSAVYKGGVICYSNWVKTHLLGVGETLLDLYGAVSAPVARQMALGAKERLEADAALSVTGLAGPLTDGSGLPVGTVFCGCALAGSIRVRQYYFNGDREAVRRQASEAALRLLLECITEENGK